MRNTRILAVLATVALAAAGCKGDKGDPGANGSNGTNGAAGSNALVAVDAAPVANCATGGSRVQVGLDANGNGTLDAAEVNAAATTYVCNGAVGGTGTAGVNTLVATTPEAAGVNCATGGIKIESGADDNGNGTLDAGEIDATSYTCNGAGGLVGPAGPQGQPGVSLQNSGFNVAVVSVTNTAPIQVRFTLKDDRGYPIDVQGVYSLNIPMTSSIRFALSRVATSATGAMLPLVVLTPGSATGAAFSPGTITGSITGASRTIVENGAGTGDYTFTFPTFITYSGPADSTYNLWIQATRQMDADDTTNPKTFWARNVEFNYIPVGTGTPLKRELVTTAACNKCHRGFTPEGSTGNSFHGSGRVEAPYCNVCHNQARSNQAADSNVFVHRIHNSHALQRAETLTTGSATRGSQTVGGVTTACTEAAPCATCTVAEPCIFNGNAFHEIEITYPQDVRNCAMCHTGAAQGAQSFTRVDKKTCTSCHDYVSFAGSQAADCTNPVARDANGVPNRCNHLGGLCTGETFCDAADQAGSACTTCHSVSNLTRRHLTVAPPDPNNVYLGGTSGNTHAAWMAAAGQVPTGASVLQYVLPANAVSLTDQGGLLRPTIRFKVTRDGVDQVFGTYDAATKPELITDFVGGPSLYFAYAVPQDGVATPADFNVTASGYLKNIWKGTATGTGAGTLAGPDATGFYTVTLTGVAVPASATMFTGGVGYTYGLGSATNNPPFANNTQPFTQTNVPGFAYTANACGTGEPLYCGGTGGLIVPVPNVWQALSVSTGTSSVGFGGSGGNTACSPASPCTCTATNPCFPTGVRRAIVANSKCHDCHAPLGVAPSFHAGQRNDGPTCSFCHNPNRTSSAWSANGKDAIHAIHGARKRAAAYGWHAITPTQSFAEVTFPGELNNCTACHVADTFDFSATASARALPNLLWSTVGQGRYDNRAAFNASWFTVSPYVVADRSVDYGFGFSTGNVNYTLPDGISGTQGGVACTPAAPCACTAANPCTIDVNGPVTIQGVDVTFAQGTPAVNCTAGAPCTCTTAATCTGRVATCTPAAPCAAQGTTLVKSPVTSACSACHDTSLAIDHMQAMGGYFYAPRATAIGAADGVNGPTQEQCMLCHAKGKIAAIRDVHK